MAYYKRTEPKGYSDALNALEQGVENEVDGSVQAFIENEAVKISPNFIFFATSADKVNPDAVRIMMQLYGIDMQTQQPKRLADLPPVDIVITMGCGVQCPVLPCSRREDWGLDDPTGKGDAAFEKTAKEIERKIQALKESIKLSSK